MNGTDQKISKRIIELCFRVAATDEVEVVHREGRTRARYYYVPIVLVFYAADIPTAINWVLAGCA